MKNRMLLCLSALAIVGMISCTDDSTEPTKNNLVTFTATLTPGEEIPTPTGSPSSSGTFIATLDTITNVFTYDFTFTGMTSNVNNGHIHGPADKGVAAAALLNFNTQQNATFTGFGATSGNGHGTALLTSATTFSTTVNGDSLKKLLFAGKAYANIHTTTNAQGEIRGQITKK